MDMDKSKILLGINALHEVGHLTACWLVYGNLDILNGAEIDSKTSVTFTSEIHQDMPIVDYEASPNRYLLEVWQRTCLYMGGYMALRKKMDSHEDAMEGSEHDFEECETYLKDCDIKNPKAFMKSACNFLDGAFEEVFGEMLQLAILLVDKIRISNQDFYDIFEPQNSNE